MLRRWQPEDVAPFAVMNADPVVMEFFPAPLTVAETREYVERIETCFETNGYGLWAVEVQGGRRFAGFVGLSPVDPPYPFAPAVEIGWRLARECWGHGFATEAALASLGFGLYDIGLDEVVSFTSAVNTRSRRVMQRIGMIRNPADDFDHPKLLEGQPLRRHVLYRSRRSDVRLAG